MMNIVPVGHRVLIKVKPFEEVSAGGIVMATGDGLTRERYSQDEGEVVALGPQAYQDLGDGTPWCKVGDMVFVNRHSGVFKTDLETKDIYRLINDQDVLGVVRSEQ